MDKRTGQTLYAPDLSMRGYKNLESCEKGLKKDFPPLQVQPYIKSSFHYIILCFLSDGMWQLYLYWAISSKLLAVVDAFLTIRYGIQSRQKYFKPNSY